ncbi:MAG: DUF4340 domain-containing protein [Candidatus Krumholzibacteria bacterium]|nr:DUF4340 domain-containing protein [Candidatus Krumholzibacteria bacterium]
MKKEYIILAATIVALGLYLVLRNTDRTHYEIPEIDTPDAEQVTRLDIIGPSGRLEMKKSGDSWLSEPEGYPIEKGKVDGMLEALGGLDIVSLVSEAESYVQYDLGNKKRVFVEASSIEKSLLKLDIGKVASTQRHTYVKLVDDKNVYQVSGNIRRTFDVEIWALRDKKVMTLDRNLITGLTIETDGEKISLTKISNPVEPVEEGQPPQMVTAWITADSTEADGKIIDGILGRLANLQSDGFPEDDEQVDMSEPAFTLTIHGTKSETLKIYGLSGEKMFLASSSQYEFPFMLAEWKLSQIRKTPSDVMGQADEKE